VLEYSDHHEGTVRHGREELHRSRVGDLNNDAEVMAHAPHTADIDSDVVKLFHVSAEQCWTCGQ
jgi:hypothetical protein